MLNLVVGLGNPGPEYLLTRHNAGFILADVLHQYYKLGEWQQKFRGQIAKGFINTQPAIDLNHKKDFSQGSNFLLLKPLAFMNFSGASVQEAAHFYKILPSQIFVLHDDMDLPFGTIKAKQGGGNAGHNGLKNIEKNLGTNKFWRLRIGVGRPKEMQQATNHVLGNFSKSEQPELMDLYDRICCFFSLFLIHQPNIFIQKASNL